MDLSQIIAIIVGSVALLMSLRTLLRVSGLEHEMLALKVGAEPMLQRTQSEYAKPPKTIEQLAAQQGVKPFDFAEARRAANFWPEDESADEFTAWLRASRKEGATERELD